MPDSTVDKLVETSTGLDVRFCEVMDVAPVMIWVSGEDKGCVWFNRPWLVFTGRSMAQEIGTGWTEGLHRADFDSCLNTYTSHFDQRRDFQIQYRLRRHDGAYRWIDDTGIPRYAPDGTFLGYIGSCVDIHEYRETQSELRRRLLEIAELNRHADAATLAASIIHEIKQPLAAIVNNSDIAQRGLAAKTPKIGEARERLNHIAADLRRTIQIIDSIGAMFKKERLRGTIVNLNDVIREALTIIDRDLQLKDISVRAALCETLPEVLGDRVQLQQVMINLIKNAIEAMELVPIGSRELHLTTEIDDHRSAMITVQDSGAGIDPENRERVFDRFFTTKSNGMGVGLSICRSIIDAHNGRLLAVPMETKGAAFRIVLPLITS